MTKELTTTNNLEMLNALRNTVAPGLTDPEFMLFAEMCRATGLNPATKEIWAIKAGGRLQLMTGINGFLKIANSHPAYDGMEVDYEWDEKGLVAATVKVYRKDRRFPSVATAYMSEYAKPTPIWKQMPSVMLAKCAKSLAIREAFINELGGLYTQEEMPSDFAAPRVEVVNTETGEIQTMPTKQLRALDKAQAKAAKAEFDADEIPDWGPKAKTTYYDLSSLSGATKTKAEEYLRNCEAKPLPNPLRPDLWRSSIRLERLTQYITEDVTDAESIES
jgi:phage recombination protein Bet